MNIGDWDLRLSGAAEKGTAIGAQHVNGRNHHAPKREECRPLKDMKMLIIESVSKSAENDHDFGREIRKPRQRDGGEYAKAECKRRQRHLFWQATHRIKVE